MSDFRLCVRAPMLRERRAPVRMLRVRECCAYSRVRVMVRRGEEGGTERWWWLHVSDGVDCGRVRSY